MTVLCLARLLRSTGTILRIHAGGLLLNSFEGLMQIID